MRTGRPRIYPKVEGKSNGQIWREANRERDREINWNQALRRVGLTQTQHDSLMESQKGLCAICRNLCKTGERLCIDHDHETGKVRGLLCRTCNAGLGLFKDSAALVRAAARYLHG